MPQFVGAMLIEQNKSVWIKNSIDLAYLYMRVLKCAPEGCNMNSGNFSMLVQAC